MKTRIEREAQGFWTAKKKYLFFWIKITDLEFITGNACFNWVKYSYIPKKKKSVTANFSRISETFEFTPEYRSKFDRTFN